MTNSSDIEFADEGKKLMQPTDVNRDDVSNATTREGEVRGLRTGGLIPLGGAAAGVGAALAIIGNALILGADPVVASDIVSYPLSANAFRLGQVFFTLTQALMAAGIVALVGSRMAGAGWRARLGGGLAVLGFVVTIPGELVLAFVATQAIDSNAANAASSVFGIGMLLADIGLILFGVDALRARTWPRPWSTLPITLGMFQLLVVTPVVLGAGFASVGAFVVITLQDLLIGAIGLRLWSERTHDALVANPQAP